MKLPPGIALTTLIWLSLSPFERWLLLSLGARAATVTLGQIRDVRCAISRVSMGAERPS